MSQATAKNRSSRVGRTFFVVLALAIIAGAVFWFIQPRTRPDLSTPIQFHEHVDFGSLSGANVLFITIDTVRRDHVGCYGYVGAQTPNIDSLADRGVRLDHAVTGVPITLPSHASMMTGLNVPNHGVHDNGRYTLDESFTTLAESLKSAGYETGAVVAAFVLDSRYGLAQGFDTYDDDTNPGLQKMGEAPGLRRGAHVTDSAIDRLRSLAAPGDESPWFVWVHYYDPHYPYDAPSKFSTAFPQTAIGQYDAEIAYTDYQVGRLLATLDELGVRDDTLIVLCSDHGEGLGEHHEATHTRLIYDTTMRIPMIISSPTLFDRAYRVDDVTVGTIDIMPTVLSLLGIEQSIEMDGLDLTSTKPAADRAMYLESLYPLLSHGWSPLSGLRRVHDKYIAAPRCEYYDLTNDPRELKNLCSTGAGGDLADQLAQWHAEHSSLHDAASRADTLNAEAQHLINALGYTGTKHIASDTPHPDPKDMMPKYEAYTEALGRAKRKADTGEFEESRRILLDVLEVAPHDVEAVFHLSVVYEKLDDLDQAEKVLRDTMEDTGLQPILAQRLAEKLVFDRRFDEAEELLRLLEAADPLNGFVPMMRGDMRAMEQRYQDAMALFEKAIEIDPVRVGGEVRERIARLKKMFELHGPPS